MTGDAPASAPEMSLLWSEGKHCIPAKGPQPAWGVPAPFPPGVPLPSEVRGGQAGALCSESRPCPWGPGRTSLKVRKADPPPPPRGSAWGQTLAAGEVSPADWPQGTLPGCDRRRIPRQNNYYCLLLQAWRDREALLQGWSCRRPSRPTPPCPPPHTPRHRHTHLHTRADRHARCTSEPPASLSLGFQGFYEDHNSVRA